METFIPIYFTQIKTENVDISISVMLLLIDNFNHCLRFIPNSKTFNSSIIMVHIEKSQAHSI